jgi:hypothetical protein
MTLRVYRARTPYSYGPFYDLLVERFPEHRTVQHVFDILRLGRELGVTGETTYRMFRHDLVPPRTAVKLAPDSDTAWPNGIIGHATYLASLKKNHPRKSGFWTRAAQSG